MKKSMLFSFFLLLSATAILAQDDEEKGFKKENLFTGGNVTVSFFNGQTILGANPIFGYKIADWIDAGVSFSFIYSSARDYREYNDKIRQTVYGPGVFTRLYPVKFLFAQAQLEHNFTTQKYIPAAGSSFQGNKVTVGANSLLLGLGFAQGREKWSNSFYYISVMFDVLKDLYSPYVDVSYNPNSVNDQRIDMVPIIRAGFNIALFQGRYNRD